MVDRYPVVLYNHAHGHWREAMLMDTGWKIWHSSPYFFPPIVNSLVCFGGRVVDWSMAAECSTLLKDVLYA